MSKRKREREPKVNEEDVFGEAGEAVTEVISETVPAETPTETPVETAKAAPKPAKPHKAGRDVAGEPSTDALEAALAGFGLDAEDVIGWRAADEVVSLVTTGGTRVHWPEDAERVLTDAEKGRTEPQPTGEPGGVGRFTRTPDA